MNYEFNYKEIQNMLQKKQPSFHKIFQELFLNTINIILEFSDHDQWSVRPAIFVITLPRQIYRPAEHNLKNAT